MLGGTAPAFSSLRISAEGKHDRHQGTATNSRRSGPEGQGSRRASVRAERPVYSKKTRTQKDLPRPKEKVGRTRGGGRRGKMPGPRGWEMFGEAAKKGRGLLKEKLC